ncbi:hypothetical protein V6U90_00380 [Micromonospora sp. CPCC 206060]|uniref:hypothetical protein n=1 Tax=Micromonospora sp. CPCC 206060 TaxID=3122406 RepID=UPI002FF382F4
MGVPRIRRVALATVLVALPVGLAGCGLGGGDPADEPADDRPTVEEAATRARERVQAYLDAMKAKDPAAGRAQLCDPMHEAFDAAATGPNGDFATHFTVGDAAVTEVRDTERGQQVAATVTVTVAGKPRSSGLLFTVTRSAGQWCISGETVGTAAAPTPSSTG